MEQVDGYEQTTKEKKNGLRERGHVLRRRSELTSDRGKQKKKTYCTDPK